MSVEGVSVRASDCYYIYVLTWFANIVCNTTVFIALCVKITDLINPMSVFWTCNKGIKLSGCVGRACVGRGGDRVSMEGGCTGFRLQLHLCNDLFC